MAFGAEKALKWINQSVYVDGVLKTSKKQKTNTAFVLILKAKFINNKIKHCNVYLLQKV